MGSAMMQAIPWRWAGRSSGASQELYVGRSARVSCHIRATPKAEQGATELPSAEQRKCLHLQVCQFAQVMALAQVDFPR